MVTWSWFLVRVSLGFLNTVLTVSARRPGALAEVSPGMVLCSDWEEERKRRRRMMRTVTTTRKKRTLLQHSNSVECGFPNSIIPSCAAHNHIISHRTKLCPRHDPQCCVSCHHEVQQPPPNRGPESCGGLRPRETPCSLIQLTSIIYRAWFCCRWFMFT